MKICFVIALVALPLTLFAQANHYTIAFLNKKPGSEKVDQATTQKLMEGHMANIRRLGEEGKLLAAGPFEGGGGIFIFNTEAVEEAEEWLSSDPAVQAKRWNIEILPYIPRIGSVCPVKGNIEMVPYTLVRFDAIVDKFTAGTYPSIIRQHEAYLKDNFQSSDIVTEAIFGANEGGILIVKSELPEGAFNDDPGVQQGLLDVVIKKLYVPKTNFCER